MQKITKQRDVCLIQMHSKYLQKPYSATSLIFFSSTNWLRKLIISFTLNPRFDAFILCVIMLNCFLLSIDDYTSGNWKNIVDTVLVFIFLGECLLKIFSMGFLFGKNTYLTDPWNILDFVVVVTGVVGFVAGGSNVSVIRTVRILRPLRTINSIPEMKVLTLSILAAIPMLVDVFILILMFMLIFGLVGGQLYGGLFSNVCYNIDGTTNWKVCYSDPTCQEFEINCGNTGCDINQYCWNSGVNPNQGAVAFDNIPLAFITIYTCITMEGWSDVMRLGRDVTNEMLLNDIFFYVMIFVGSFFLMNLTFSHCRLEITALNW